MADEFIFRRLASSDDPRIEWAHAPQWLREKVEQYNRANPTKRIELTDTEDVAGNPISLVKFFEDRPHPEGGSKEIQKPNTFQLYYSPEYDQLGVSKNNASRVHFFASSAQIAFEDETTYRALPFVSRSHNIEAFLRTPNDVFHFNPQAAINRGAPYWDWERNELTAEVMRSMQGVVTYPEQATYWNEQGEKRTLRLHSEHTQFILGGIRSQLSDPTYVQFKGFLLREPNLAIGAGPGIGIGSLKDYQRYRRERNVLMDDLVTPRPFQMASAGWEGEPRRGGYRMSNLFLDDPLFMGISEGGAFVLSGQRYVASPKQYTIPSSRGLSREAVEEMGFKIGALYSNEAIDVPEGLTQVARPRALGAFQLSHAPFTLIAGLTGSPEVGWTPSIVDLYRLEGAIENKENPAMKRVTQGASREFPAFRWSQERLGKIPDILSVYPSKPERETTEALEAFYAHEGGALGAYQDFMEMAGRVGLTRYETEQMFRVQGTHRQLRGGGFLFGEDAWLQFRHDDPRALPLVAATAREYMRQRSGTARMDTWMSTWMLEQLHQQMGEEAFSRRFGVKLETGQPNTFIPEYQMGYTFVEQFGRPQAQGTTGSRGFTIHQLNLLARNQPAAYAEIMRRERAGEFPNKSLDIARANLANTMGVLNATVDVNELDLAGIRREALQRTSGEAGPHLREMLNIIGEQYPRFYLSSQGKTLPPARSLTGMMGDLEFINGEPERANLGSRVAGYLNSLALGQPASLEDVLTELSTYASQITRQATQIKVPSFTGMVQATQLLPDDMVVASKDSILDYIRRLNLPETEKRELRRRLERGEGVSILPHMKDTPEYIATPVARLYTKEQAEALVPGIGSLDVSAGRVLASQNMVGLLGQDADGDLAAFTILTTPPSKLDFTRQKQLFYNPAAEPASLIGKALQAGAISRLMRENPFETLQKGVFRPASSYMRQAELDVYNNAMMGLTFDPFVEGMGGFMAALSAQTGKDPNILQRAAGIVGGSFYQLSMDKKLTPGSNAMDWLVKYWQSFAIGNPKFTEESAKQAGRKNNLAMSQFKTQGMSSQEKAAFESAYGGGILTGDIATLALRLFDRTAHLGIGQGDSQFYTGGEYQEGFASSLAYMLAPLSDVDKPGRISAIEQALIGNMKSLQGGEWGLMQNPLGLAKILGAITGKTYTDKEVNAFRRLTAQPNLVGAYDTDRYQSGKNPLMDDIIRLYTGAGGSLSGMNALGAYMLAIGGSNTEFRWHVQPQLNNPLIGQTLLDPLREILSTVRTGISTRRGTTPLEKALPHLLTSGLSTSPAEIAAARRLTEDRGVLARIQRESDLSLHDAEEFTGEELTLNLLRYATDPKKYNFSEGGPTDPHKGKFEVAGVVHGGEYVIKKEDVERIRSGDGSRVMSEVEQELGLVPGYAKGGEVSVSPRYKTFIGQLQKYFPELDDVRFNPVEGGRFSYKRVFDDPDVRGVVNVPSDYKEFFQGISKGNLAYSDFASRTFTGKDKSSYWDLAKTAIMHELGHHMDERGMSRDEIAAQNKEYIQQREMARYAENSALAYQNIPIERRAWEGGYRLSRILQTRSKRGFGEFWMGGLVRGYAEGGEVDDDWIAGADVEPFPKSYLGAHTIKGRSDPEYEKWYAFSVMGAALPPVSTNNPYDPKVRALLGDSDIKDTGTSRRRSTADELDRVFGGPMTPLLGGGNASPPPPPPDIPPNLDEPEGPRYRRDEGKRNYLAGTDSEGRRTIFEWQRMTERQAHDFIRPRVGLLNRGRGAFGLTMLQSAGFQEEYDWAMGIMGSAQAIDPTDLGNLSTEELRSIQQAQTVLKRAEKHIKSVDRAQMTNSMPRIDDKDIYNRVDLGAALEAGEAMNAPLREGLKTAAIREKDYAGYARAGARMRIGDEAVSGFAMVDKFIGQMEELGRVTQGVTEHNDYFIKQAKQTLSVFDDWTETLKAADDALKAVGGNKDLLQDKNLRSILDMAEQPGLGGKTIRETLSGMAAGPMGDLRQQFSAEMMSRVLDPFYDPEQRQSLMTQSLLQRGRVGAIRRNELFAAGILEAGGGEAGFDAGLPGMRNIRSRGTVETLGKGARFAEGLNSAMWAYTHAQWWVLDPMAQQIEGYETAMAGRQMALAQSGLLGSQDLMSGTYGTLMQRRGLQQQYTLDIGQQLSTAYGGMLTAGSGLGRTAGAAVAIGGPALAASMITTQLAGPFAGAVVGGATALGATGNYLWQTANDLSSSTDLYRQAYGARSGGLLSLAGYAVTHPLDVASSVLGSIVNPTLQGEAQQLGYIGQQLSDKYYTGVGQTPAGLSRDTRVGHAQMLRQAAASYPNLSQTEIRSQDYNAWIRTATTQYGLNEEQASQLYTYNSIYNPEWGPAQPYFQQQLDLAQRGLSTAPSSLRALQAMGYLPANVGMQTSLDQGISSYISRLPSELQPLALTQMDFQAVQLQSVNTQRSMAGLSPINTTQIDPLLADPRTSGIYLQGLSAQASVRRSNYRFSDTAISGTGATFDSAYQDRLRNLLRNNRLEDAIALTSGYGLAGTVDTQLYNRSDFTPQQSRVFESQIQGMSQDQQYQLSSILSGDRFMATKLMGATNRSYRLMDLQTGFDPFEFNPTGADFANLSDTAAMYGMSDLVRPELQGRSRASLQRELYDIDRQRFQDSFYTQDNLRLLNRSAQMGGALGFNAQGFAVGGDNLAGMAQVAAQYGLSFNPGNGMGAFQIQDTQTLLQRQQQDWSLMRAGQNLMLQRQQFEVSGRQFYENFGLNQRQLEISFGRQETEMGIGREQQLTRFGWQEEDLAYNRSQLDINFGWGMEDFDRNIRYARGRQRRDLMREQERATVRYAMQSGQMDRQGDRLEQEKKWAEEQYDRNKKYFEDDKKLQQERLELSRKHFEEDRKFAEQRIVMAEQDHVKDIQWLNESRTLEDQNRLLQRQQWAIQDTIQQRFSEQMFQLDTRSRGLNLQLQLMGAAMQVLHNQYQLQLQDLQALPPAIQAVIGAFQSFSSGSVIGPVQGTTPNPGYGSLLPIVPLPPPTPGRTPGAIPVPGGGGGFHPAPYATGGYTGDAPSGTPAGIVHSREYVIPEGGAPVVRGGVELLVPLLKRMIQLMEQQKPPQVNVTLADKTGKLDSIPLSQQARARM